MSVDLEYEDRKAAEIDAERHAKAEVIRLAREIAEASRLLWVWGDGHGAFILETMEAALYEAGMEPRQPHASEPSRRKVPYEVRKQVLERDAYRCVSCGSWKDLHVDHIVPRAQGGSDDPENLQVLCAGCNMRKGAK